MKQRRFHKRPIEEPAVNLTPLIDVVFVILIMFILVAPLLELDRIDLANAGSRQESTNLEVHESSPISIHVQADNTLWINKRKIPSSDLVPTLKEAKKNYPKARPQLFHDKKAQFGTYQSVKNALEEAGFEQMDIVLTPVI
jgi:biopolymer transport protein ExbD